MTRTFHRSGLFLLLFAAAVSCKKSGGGEPGPDLPKPQAVARGAADGAAVTKTIGPAGGVLHSADGQISLEVPAGAVAAATQFSIQPVQNTLASGAGASYRLLPESVQFQKDVKITLRYEPDSLGGTAEDDLYLAFQDAEGFWHREIMTSIDKAGKTLTVQTRHFSDWTIERIFWIKASDKTLLLEANEEVGLFTYWQDVEKGTNKIVDGGLVPDKNVETWFANGPGTFNFTRQSAVTYKAPASIPERREVAVGVRIKNMVSQRHPDRPGNGGLVIVQVPMVLLPAEYFTWYVDGQTHIAYSVDAALIGTSTNILGTGLTGGVNLFISGGGTGKYETGSAVEEKKFNVQLSLSNGNPPIYLTEYYPCGGGGTRYGTGELNISSYGNIGESISGWFVATVYAPGSGCEPRTKRVSGSFRIKRKL